jgi:hypothetical protein
MLRRLLLAIAAAGYFSRNRKLLRGIVANEGSLSEESSALLPDAAVAAAIVAGDGFSRNQLQGPLRVMVAGGFLAYIAPFTSFGGVRVRRRVALAA